MRFRFDLLGSLSVSRDGQPIRLGPVKQRLLLASLLLTPGRTIGTEELVTMVWADEPPASAAANLRTYAHGLRRALGEGGGRWERMPVVAGGYLLRLEPGERDLDRFDAAATRGRAALAAGDRVAAETELAAAVGMWRGEPLADLPLPPRLARRTARLTERRLLAEEDYAEAVLAAGTPAEVVHRLEALLDRHPLRQRAWALLMLGRYRLGDVAGALAVYQRARRLLAEETGLDPGPELTRLHDDILHNRPAQLVDPSPGRPAAARSVAGPLSRRPEQLPLAVPGFVGRAAELEHLDDLLDGRADGPTTVIISAVSGMAGIGKTTLALRWAHRIADRFPDGQLYLNLRGYDDTGAVSTADAVRSFLEALDIPQTRIPASTDARIGLYRSMLASRRLLIVLDNARDSDQVRPLLPGTGGCAVVVTSRDQLNGLVAAEGARPLTLDVLTDDESRKLLGNWIGEDRLAAEPEATATIIEATGRLPLALAIVAARVAAKPTFPLAAFAAELRPTETRLGVLADGDVRRVFSWSYQALDDDAARLFRLLGLHPGPDLTGEVAAALAGEDPGVVMRSLRKLTRLHLATEHLPGRYAFHDLLRTYAAELAQSSEPADERADARRRMYDHYLHCAHPAARLIRPQWKAVELVPPLPTNRSAPPADRDAALAWFAAERRVLVRVVRQAGENGAERYAWQLAWTLATYHLPNGHWQDHLGVQQVAVAAAEKAGDCHGQAMANRLLARAATRLGEYDTAEVCLRRSLMLYQDLADLGGQAQTLHNCAELWYLQGKVMEGVACGREAMRLYRMIGDRTGEGRALNSIGYLQANAGDYQSAIASCTEALALLREVDDRNGQAATLDSIGFAYAQLGDHQLAAARYEESLDLFRESADRYHEAETLMRLGDARLALADPAAAAAAWRDAARSYDDLGDPAADEARRRLAQLEFPDRSH